jgi:hypothetical protein
MPVPGIPNGFVQYRANLTNARCEMYEAVITLLRAYANGIAGGKEKVAWEGFGVALDGPMSQAKAGASPRALPPLASSSLCAPVLELADRSGLQPRAHSRRPGPIPGWGITSPTAENR